MYMYIWDTKLIITIPADDSGPNGAWTLAAMGMTIVLSSKLLTSLCMTWGWFLLIIYLSRWIKNTLLKSRKVINNYFQYSYVIKYHFHYFQSMMSSCWPQFRKWRWLCCRLTWYERDGSRLFMTMTLIFVYHGGVGVVPDNDHRHT